MRIPGAKIHAKLSLLFNVSAMLHWVQVNTGGHGIISKKFTKWLNIALFHEEVSHLKAWGMEHKDRTGANGQFT